MSLPSTPAERLLAPWTGAACTHHLAPLFQSQHYGKGVDLLRQGTVWKDVYVVDRGLLRMHFDRRDGKEFNKSFHAEGALICPITQAMAESASLFSISAVEPTVVWKAPAPRFRSLLLQLDAWEPLRTQLLERLVTQKLQREHDLLAHDGRTRYQQFCQSQPGLAQRVPLLHLATYLGITDVSLSRIRAQLRLD